MSLFLVRHDRVDAPGLCYGQTDLPSTVPYAQTAQAIAPLLPNEPARIISSPLQRCRLLAQALYPGQIIQTDARWQEVNFGDWEQQPWSDLPRDAIDRWATTPTDFQFPHGESLFDFSQRIDQALAEITSINGPLIVVTHAGVIRLCRARLLGLDWATELSFAVPYASVLQLSKNLTV